MTTPEHFDFDKWYAEQDPIAKAAAAALGEREQNAKWSAVHYERAALANYAQQKDYALSMTTKTRKAWIASASGSVESADAMLGDKVLEYLK